VYVDWLKASGGERTRLYALAKDVGGLLNMSVEQILFAALGREVALGSGYIDNFRKGKLRRSYAKLVFEWIAEHHSDIARGFVPEWFPVSALSAWDQYVEEHGIRGALQIKRFVKDELNLIKKVKDRRHPDAKLKLGEEFCFFLRCEFNAYAIGFERYRGKWHTMPLGEDGAAIFTLHIEEPHFPKDKHGAIERLSEESDLGLHRFVIAIAEKAFDLPDKPDGAAITQGVSLYYLDVLFSA